MMADRWGYQQPCARNPKPPTTMELRARRAFRPEEERQISEWLAAQGGNMRQCLRADLRALYLPCGERVMCWRGERCQMVPEGKKKPTRFFETAAYEKGE